MKTFVDGYYDPNYNNGQVAGILSSEDYWTHATVNNTNLPYPKNADYPYLNASGFSALPAGVYYFRTNNNLMGNFFGLRAYFWTSTLNNNGTDKSGTLFYWYSDYGGTYTIYGETGNNWSAAAPIRCVRD